MTTTDFSAPPPPPPPPPPMRAVRRSTTDRVAAGVCGGLGDYFGVDPVLFRVLFAVTAFFGGAGILAYLLAWAVIPDTSTPDAPLDRVVREMRKRRIPFWLVAGIVIFVAWALLFSWWAPWPFAPVIIAVVVLVAALSRRKTGQATPAPTSYIAPGAVAGPESEVPNLPFTPSTDTSAAPTGWMPETQAWFAESRARSRIRRRRAAPVRWATLATLAVTVAILAVADAVSGIVIPAYLWTVGGIVLAGLIVGLILRRTPWTLSILLVPTILALIAFGGTRSSLHDGSGQRVWTPSSVNQLQSSYRLAFGQGVLDLSNVSLDSPKQISMTMAAGQVRILVPKGLNIQVHADIHLGTIEVDGRNDFLPGGTRPNGLNLKLDVPSTTTASGPALSIDVHLADGQVSIEHL
jgi:phage shock protein PspC (stress-responsive transcriptional regulator)